MCWTHTSIDVKTIWLIPYNRNIGIQIKENITSWHSSCTISSVQGNLQSTKINTCCHQKFFILTKTFWIIYKCSKTLSWWTWKSILCCIKKGFNFRFTRIIQFKAISPKELNTIIKSWIMAGWDHNTSTGIFRTYQVWNTWSRKYPKFVDFDTYW